MTNSRSRMTTSFSSVTLLILSVVVRDCCCFELGAPLPPKFGRIWTKQTQQRGLTPPRSSSSGGGGGGGGGGGRQHDRSSLGGLARADDGSSRLRPALPVVYGDNSGETGESPAVSGAASVPAQSAMYWDLDGRPTDSRLDRKRARERGAFVVVAPEPTDEKASTSGQRRRSSDQHSVDNVQRGSARRELDDEENGDVLSMKGSDDQSATQKDFFERKEETGHGKNGNGIGPGVVSYHNDDDDDDSADDDSTTTDSGSRLEPAFEGKQYVDAAAAAAEAGSVEEDSFPNRKQRWSTDAVRVWGRKRAWEMDPVRVWGKRKWEMDPVRVWGKRGAWEMDPVRVWGKRAWEMDPVRVWGKRAWGSDPVRVVAKRAWDNDSVRVWGKREWETDPVRVWGK